MNRRAQVILVTGASSGIGLAIARHLGDLGHQVFGGSRRQIDSHQFEQIVMDVDDDLSVDRGVEKIIHMTGRIDAVINSAGFGIVGAVENTSIGEAKAQFETNFFGTLRVCNAVLPIMRQQRAGLIVNVSSLAGLLAIPFHGLYSASKFALEGLTEALRMEVKPFGIRVILIEPGDYRTAFSVNRRQTSASLGDSPYRGAAASLARMEQEEQAGRPPQEIARLVGNLLHHRRPKLRYRVGKLGQRLVPNIRSIIPYSLYEWLLMKYYNVQGKSSG
ncbi:MAG: Oxidoreductase, short-chain dehydrogenase/reductase family [Bryobacterales bacterium]|nr:Oxidoreductase, short-chain dehydrogenase/reductase family [Bryobacterales bacterium]